MSKQVLVVDDDESIRELVEAALRTQDLDVRQAANGAEALRVCGEHPPDVILLDMRMPVMDGRAFIENYRKCAGMPAPIIAFTASVDPDLELGDLSPQAILHKPFNIDDLLSTVQSVMH